MRLIFNLLPLLNFEQKKSFFNIIFFNIFHGIFRSCEYWLYSTGGLFFLGEQLINVKFFFLLVVIS